MDIARISTCCACMKLTEEAREVIKSASKDLNGSALRRFMADTVRKLGRGGQRKAQRELGWGRDTIRKGEHELRTGIACVDGRCGNRAGVDERLPNLKADIKDVDPTGQAGCIRPRLRFARLLQSWKPSNPSRS